jgi:hypothetical protein
MGYMASNNVVEYLQEAAPSFSITVSTQVLTWSLFLTQQRLSMRKGTGPTGAAGANSKVCGWSHWRAATQNQLALVALEIAISKPAFRA